MNKLPGPVQRLRPVTRRNRVAWLLLVILAWGSGLRAQEKQPQESLEEKQALAVVRGGMVMGDGSYAPGEQVELEAVPFIGHAFVRWEGEGLPAATQPKITITMDRHLRVKPVFRRIWNVIVYPDPPQSAEVTGGGNYTIGQWVDISVTPAEGFEFERWEGVGVQDPEAPETRLRVTGTHNVKAVMRQANQDKQQQDQQDQQDSQSQQNQDQQQDQQQGDSSDSESGDESDSSQQESAEDSQSGDESEEQDADRQEESGDEEQSEEQPGQDDAEQQEGQEQGEGEQGDGEELSAEDLPERGEDGQPQQGQQRMQADQIMMTREEARLLLEALGEREKKLPIGDLKQGEAERAFRNKKDW